MTDIQQDSKSTRKKSQRLRKPKFKDHFIREVRVQYEALSTEMFKISDAEDVATFLRQVAFDNCREHFFALYLDGSHQVACYSLIALGGANSCPVHPREIFQRALVCGAIAVIIAHNHPSGQLDASEADWFVSHKMKSAGELVGITVLDHIIFSDASVLSMRSCSRWDRLTA